MRQSEQIIFAPSKHGGPQHGGQRQIILGRGKEGQKRGQVFHRKFRPDAQLVGPGDGNVARFAGTDQFVKQLASGPDQHQNVARIDGA